MSVFLEKRHQSYLEFYFVDELEPPCVLGLDVMGDAGEQMFSSDETLTDEDIETLKENNVSQVIVRREGEQWTVSDEEHETRETVEIDSAIPQWLTLFLKNKNLYQFTENMANFLDFYGNQVSEDVKRIVTELLEQSLNILQSLHELNLRLETNQVELSIPEVIEGHVPDNEELEQLSFDHQKEIVESVRLRDELIYKTAEFIQKQEDLFSSDELSDNFNNLDQPREAGNEDTSILGKIRDKVTKPLSEGLLKEQERAWAHEVLDTPVIDDNDTQMTYLFTRTQQFLENFLFRGVVLESLADELLEHVSRHILTEDKFFRRLTVPSNNETYLLSHIVNVLILSVFLGQNLGFDRNDLRRLTLSSLFHDVGMLKNDPDNWAFSPEYHDEMSESITRHPVSSKELMEAVPYVFHEDVKKAVLHHHERLDGEGYPNGEKADKLSRLTRVLMIADVYEAMSTPRPYRSAIRCDRIISYLGEKTNKFDEDMVDVLKNSLGVYPSGTVVRLNTDEIGVVVAKGNDPDNPRIKVIIDPSGDVYDDPDTIDLSDSERSVLETIGTRSTSQALLQSM